MRRSSWSDPPSRWHWVATLALLLSLGGGLLLALSGPGYRLGLWSLAVGLQRMLAWGAYAGVAGAAIGLVALWLNPPRANARAFMRAGTALLAGLLVAGIPYMWQRTAQRVPRIHDITTDTEDVPQFDKVTAVRTAAGAANGLDYTPEIAAQQKQGYPDLAPLRLPVPPARAFDMARALVAARGWEVVSIDSASGQIEATDQTLWFGFKDDIVIRIRPDGDGSRVDVRSVSRVGRSDVGTNARRIREFLADLAG
jgi:uncharacterized protein (DUF1499 family)